MRTADIQPGGLYMVHVGEVAATFYGGCDLVAKVVRAGFYYQVETVTGTRVRGAPHHRYHESEHPNGVEIVWPAQDVWSNRRGFGKEQVMAGRAVVNARAVKYAVHEPQPQETP